MKGAIMFSGGGSGKLFAAIGVTYPAGSTLTCTNGTKTLTAKTTSGQWVFAIPEAGTWTVTATQGTNTKSQSVEITTEGQLESVELSYQFVLFDGGQIVPMSSGFVYTGCSVSFAGGLITVTSTEYGSVSAVTDNKLSLDRYNTLFVEIVSTNTSGSNGNNSSVFVGGSRDLDPENSGDFRAWKDVSGKTGVQGLDISKLTGNHYVGIGISRAGKFVVSKIWLE